VVSLAGSGPETPVQVTAVSPKGHRATTSVTVRRGTMPAITAVAPADRSKLYIGVQRTVQITVNDPDEDETQVRVLLNGAELFPWSSETSPRWTPPADHRGPNRLEIQAKDAFGGITSKQVEIYVARQPIAPPAP
jgi:hypothetical protein